MSRIIFLVFASIMIKLLFHIVPRNTCLQAGLCDAAEVQKKSAISILQKVLVQVFIQKVCANSVCIKGLFLNWSREAQNLHAKVTERCMEMH